MQMRSAGILLLATALTAGICTEATGQDVIVFRRTIADPNRVVPTPTPTDAPGIAYRWDRGAWSEWSSLCSVSAKRTRRVDCMANGVVTADQQACVEATGQAAESEETKEVTSDCEYTPTYTDWGTCTPKPLGEGTQTRELTTCTRSDGKDVALTECEKEETERSCTPSSPDELIENGTIESNTNGWVFTGEVVRSCGTGSTGCWLQSREAGSTLSYATPHAAMAGVTYQLSFSYGNLAVEGNRANTTWKVTAGSTTLLSGTISSSGRLGSVRNFGTFVGTGTPVTLTITRTRSDTERIGYDDFSIFKQ